MSTSMVPVNIPVGATETSHRVDTLRKVLLMCGIFSSLLYIAINIISPLYYRGYDIASQTVSELSAIDAPSRGVWIPLCTGYSLLVLAFAAGVWLCADQNKKLAVVAMLMLLYAVAGFYWPPMHQRQVIAAGGATGTDTMHIVFAFFTVVLMFFMVGVGAGALGRRFRVYSIVSLLLFVFFGTLTGVDGPKISRNLPTPFIGIWERINISIFLIWVIVLATVLLRKHAKPFIIQSKKN